MTETTELVSTRYANANRKPAANKTSIIQNSYLSSAMYRELADYILKFHSSFYTENEAKASRHYNAQIKYTLDHPKIKEQLEKATSHDPAVLKLLENGYQAFKIRAAKRIFEEHSSELLLNLCPKCQKIARTPVAKQCRFCKHDWH